MIQNNLLDLLRLLVFIWSSSPTKPYTKLSQVLVSFTNDQLIHQKSDHGSMDNFVKMSTIKLMSNMPQGIKPFSDTHWYPICLLEKAHKVPRKRIFSRLYMGIGILLYMDFSFWNDHHHYINLSPAKASTNYKKLHLCFDQMCPVISSTLISSNKNSTHISSSPLPSIPNFKPNIQSRSTLPNKSALPDIHSPTISILVHSTEKLITQDIVSCLHTSNPLNMFW